MLNLMAFSVWLLLIVNLCKTIIEPTFKRSSAKRIKTRFYLLLRFDKLLSIRKFFFLVFNFLFLMLYFFRYLLFSLIVLPLKLKPMLSSFLLILKLFDQKDICILSVSFSRFTNLFSDLIWTNLCVTLIFQRLLLLIWFWMLIIVF